MVGVSVCSLFCHVVLSVINSNAIIMMTELVGCFTLIVFLYLCVVLCYDIMPVRKEEGKSYWKIPLCDDDATREK